MRVNQSWRLGGSFALPVAPRIYIGRYDEDLLAAIHQIETWGYITPDDLPVMRARIDWDN